MVKKSSIVIGVFSMLTFSCGIPRGDSSDSPPRGQILPESEKIEVGIFKPMDNRTNFAIQGDIKASFVFSTDSVKKINEFIEGSTIVFEDGTSTSFLPLEGDLNTNPSFETYGTLSSVKLETKAPLQEGLNRVLMPGNKEIQFSVGFDDYPLVNRVEQLQDQNPTAEDYAVIVNVVLSEHMAYNLSDVLLVNSEDIIIPATVASDKSPRGEHVISIRVNDKEALEMLGTTYGVAFKSSFVSPSSERAVLIDENLLESSLIIGSSTNDSFQKILVDVPSQDGVVIYNRD